MIPTRPTTRRPALSLPEGIRRCLYTGIALAALITLVIVAGMCPARFCCAQATQQACTLRIHVDRLRNRKGVVGALVFTSAVGWPEDVHKSFRHQYAPMAATGRSLTVVMKDLPP